MSQARVITLDPEGRQTAESEFDRAAPLDGIVVEDDHETFPPPESDDAIVWPPPRRNGWRPRPNGELKPIEWRCPDGVTVGR